MGSLPPLVKQKLRADIPEFQFNHTFAEGLIRDGSNKNLSPEQIGHNIQRYARRITGSSQSTDQSLAQPDLKTITFNGLKYTLVGGKGFY